ncbi:hypothetical protein P8452_67760 [Trifolium repens]|nr:hypothetical protein P8452_67760 [Trifolium repens]
MEDAAGNKTNTLNQPKRRSKRKSEASPEPNSTRPKLQISETPPKPQRSPQQPSTVSHGRKHPIPTPPVRTPGRRRTNQNTTRSEKHKTPQTIVKPEPQLGGADMNEQLHRRKET